MRVHFNFIHRVNVDHADVNVLKLSIVVCEKSLYINTTNITAL